VTRAATEAVRRGELALDELAAGDDGQALALLLACPNPVTAELLGRVVGPGRHLYRRVWSGSLLAVAEARGPGADFLREAAAADPARREAACAELCRVLSSRLRADVPPHALLVDVAGDGKELFFVVPVVEPAAPAGVVRTTADPEISLLAPILSQNFERQAKHLQLLAPAERVADFRRLLQLDAPAGEAER
jgi:hypothetical protein